MGMSYLFHEMGYLKETKCDLYCFGSKRRGCRAIKHFKPFWGAWGLEGGILF